MITFDLKDTASNSANVIRAVLEAERSENLVWNGDREGLEFARSQCNTSSLRGVRHHEKIDEAIARLPPTRVDVHVRGHDPIHHSRLRDLLSRPADSVKWSGDAAGLRSTLDAARRTTIGRPEFPYSQGHFRNLEAALRDAQLGPRDRMRVDHGFVTLASVVAGDRVLHTCHLDTPINHAALSDLLSRPADSVDWVGDAAGLRRVLLAVRTAVARGFSPGGQAHIRTLEVALHKAERYSGSPSPVVTAEARAAAGYPTPPAFSGLGTGTPVTVTFMYGEAAAAGIAAAERSSWHAGWNAAWRQAVENFKACGQGSRHCRDLVAYAESQYR